MLGILVLVLGALVVYLYSKLNESRRAQALAEEGLSNAYGACSSLRQYAVHLLLDDELRNDHKAKLVTEVTSNVSLSDAEVGTYTLDAVEDMADRFQAAVPFGVTLLINSVRSGRRK